MKKEDMKWLAVSVFFPYSLLKLQFSANFFQEDKFETYQFNLNIDRYTSGIRKLC